MSDTLRVAADVRGWLTDLLTSDPPMARLAGEAILALLEHPAGPGSPLMPPRRGHQPLDPREGLDEAYQHQLELLATLRRAVADVATARKRLELEIDGAEAVATSDQLGQMRARRADLERTEDKLTADSQRLQTWVESFRTRKESLKAGYTAAEAQLAVYEAAAGLGGEDDQSEVLLHDAEEAVTRARSAIAEFLGIADDLDADVRNIVGSADPGGAGNDDEYEDADQFLILRPGAPECYGVQIVCAMEPAAAGEPAAAPALLLLAAETHHVGQAAAPGDLMQVAQARYRELTEYAPGQDQPDAGWASYDKASFLAEFFPHEGAEIAAGAADLQDRSQPRSLAEVRRQAGLSQAEVAQRLRVRLDRVSAIERADLGATDVRTLAAYIAALGGELEITADIGTGRLLLR